MTVIRPKRATSRMSYLARKPRALCLQQSGCLMPKFSADGRIDRFREIPEGLQDLESEAGAGMALELLNSL